jgi:VWFA-related protein
LIHRFRHSAVLACFCGLSLCLMFLHSRSVRAVQSQRPISLRVDVDLVTAEVRAFDRKGNPIRNLKKENFHIIEDGKEQDISNFEEVIDDPKREDSSNPRKTVLILFDDNTLTSDQIKPARDSAVKFVTKHMTPRDLFAVAYTELSSLKTLQGFTGERGKVLFAAGKPETSFAMLYGRLYSQGSENHLSGWLLPSSQGNEQTRELEPSNFPPCRTQGSRQAA